MRSTTWRTSKLFDEKERALLAYVDEMADHGNVADEAFDALERFFTPTQIMELTLRDRQLLRHRADHECAEDQA